MEMKKPSLLYASPMGPMKSGISDYSEVLVAALQKKFDVTIYTDNYEMNDIRLTTLCKVVKHGCDQIDFERYDYIIYNIGNNPECHGYIYEACLQHPGMVILHDFILYYLFVGYYQPKGILYAKVFQEEGIEEFVKLKRAIKDNHTNLLEQKNLAEYFPFNSELIRSGNKIMVHSWYSYNKLLESGIIAKENIAKINMIPQIDTASHIVSRNDLLKKYHIPEDAIIISSFGYIAPTKMNHVVCDVVNKLSKKIEQKICYVMVGEGDYVNSYVDTNIIIKTGYVDLDEFNSFITCSDLIINLRHPSMGETSAAMLRILQKGKVCIINAGGWFSELPEDCVIRVKLEKLDEELIDRIHYCINNPQYRSQIEKHAKEYFIKEYNSEAIIDQIKEFL